MKRKSKWSVSAAGALLGVAALCSGVFALQPENVRADSIYYANNVFSEYYGVTMDAGYMSNNGERSGLAISAYRKGAYVTLAQQTTGTFEMEFSADRFSTGSFQLNIGNAEESFSIIVQCEKNSTTASVLYGDRQFGIFYKNGYRAGVTQEYNEKLRQYTVIDTTDAMKIIFDARTMEVKVSNDTQSLLVWKLNQSVNDDYDIGSRIYSADTYSVKLSMPNADSDKKLLLYAINGNSFATMLLNDATGPNIGVSQTSDAVCGTEYFLPTPFAFDFYDGKIENVYVEIQRGGSVYLNATLYVPGMSYLFENVGEYTVIYTAKDTKGNLGVLETNIQVFADKQEGDWKTDYVWETSTFGVGSIISIPATTYNSALSEIALPVFVSVECNGEKVEEYGDLLAENDIILPLERPGVYTILYSTKDKNCIASKELQFTVDEQSLPLSVSVDIPKMGDTLILEDITTTYKGKQYTYENIVYYPNGRAYCGNSFALTLSGKYIVEYRIDTDEGVKKYRYSFNLSEQESSISSDSSYIYEGENPYLDDVEGINLRLAENDTFLYNRVLDISDNTKDDVLITMYATPQKAGVIEAYEFSITLTDYYDADNYVTIDLIYNSGHKYTMYARVAPAGGMLTGYEYTSSGMILHQNNKWGTGVSARLYGLFHAGESAKDFPIRIYFDYESRQIYIGQGNSQLMIADLDDFNCFSTQWNGFTTGECLLSINTVTVNTASANYFISDIDGNVPSDGKLLNVQPPKIIVDYGTYEEDTIPSAEVGKPYSVFDASVVDLYSTNSVVYKSVYLAYGTEHYMNYSIENGCFIPDREGMYTIVYSVYDKYGNKIDKSVWVQAVKSSEKITINTETIVKTIEAGQPYSINGEAIGGSGNLSKELYVYMDGTYKRIEDGFIFESAGTYQAEYRVLDYNGTCEVYRYTITVTYPKKPIFINEAVYPNAFLNGKKYEVQPLYAKYYAEGFSGVDCDVAVYLVDKNGENLLTENSFVPQVETSGDLVKLIYRVSVDGQNTEKTYEIPVYITQTSEGYLIERYFYTQNVSVNANTSGTVFTTKTNGASFEFLQTAVANGFSLTFEVDENKNSFGKIVIRLFDAENFDNAIKVTIYNTGKDTSLISINDGALQSIKGSFVGSSSYAFILKWDNNSSKVSDADVFTTNVTTNEKGESFNGFKSGLIRFAVSFEEVTGESSIVLQKVANQLMVNSTTDRVDPLVGEKTHYEKSYMYLDTVQIFEVVASDVLSMNTNITYSVFAPDGSTVNATDGTPLKNLSMDMLKSFICEQYGAYSIVYKISDMRNTIQHRVSFEVVDDVAPTLTVNGKISNTAKVNCSITLPDAMATDNVQSELTVTVVCYLPSGGRRYYTPGETLTFEEKGTYTIKYLVYDTSGNFAESCFNVTVK